LLFQKIKMNAMRNIRIEKITLNVGAGKNQDVLKKGQKLIKSITGIEPVVTKTKKRIPAWGLRPGLPVGCKVTLRKENAKETLRRLLSAKSNKLSLKQFDEEGNFSFGVHEYIDIPGAKYDPEIGMMGLEVTITLERPGFRVKKRRIGKAKVSKKHKITKEEAIQFVKNEFNVEVGDE